MSDDLTLARVIARGVVVTWPEAVAVVRDVTERVLSAPSAVPELQEILIDADGSVRIASASSTKEPVRRLGQLLVALLSKGTAPVQLRLVISQATAPQPAYASAQEYFDALAYFDRPQHEQLIRELYERANAAPDVNAEASLDELAPLPSQDPTDALAKQRRKERAVRKRAWLAAVGGRVAAAVIFLVLVGLAGFRYARSRGVTLTGKEASAMAERASDALGQTVVSGVSAVSERLGLGRLVPPNATPSPPPALPPPAPAPEPKPAPRRPLRGAIVALPSFVAFDLETAPASSADLEPVAEPDQATALPSIQSGEPAIYSVGAAGVAPPIGIRPQLARELPPDLDPEHLGRIELVIAENGTVESAKLVGEPRDVRDSLLLSAVKAWDFQPALKDGVPVKYRKTIWIAEQ